MNHNDFSNHRTYRSAHLFRSGRSAVRLWLGSLLMLIFGLSIPVSLGVGLYVLLFSEPVWMQRLLICLVVTIGLGILYFMVAFGAICPLCRGRLLHLGRSSRNRKAQASLGSYRFGVASRVLTGRTFRCPHCGEPCRCERRV